MRASRVWRRYARAAHDLLLPPLCALCQLPIIAGRHGIHLCSACRNALGPSQLSWCPRCGHVWSDRPAFAARSPAGPCNWCSPTPFRFESVHPLGAYEGLRRDAVLQMKQAEGQTLAVHVGRLLGWRLRQRWTQPRLPQLIVPIPKHWARRWWRGTNSAECLAEGIARVLHIPWQRGVLEFTRLTDKQSLLNQAARRRNLRGALSVRPGHDLTGRSVLLIDDLMTTGATMDEATRVMLRHGAAAVHVAVVCRA